jgi:hypothetical protein
MTRSVGLTIARGTASVRTSPLQCDRRRICDLRTPGCRMRDCVAGMRYKPGRPFAPAGQRDSRKKLLAR